MKACRTCGNSGCQREWSVGRIACWCPIGCLAIKDEVEILWAPEYVKWLEIQKAMPEGALLVGETEEL